MAKFRALWLGLIGCAWALGTAAQTQTPALVTINGHWAHPTRVLARFAQPHQLTSLSTLATLKSAGFSIRRQYALIPGAVVFDYRPTVAPQSATSDPDAQAQALAARMNLLRSSGLFSYVEPDYWVTNLLTEPTDARYVDGTLWGLKNRGQAGGVVGADVITDPAGSSSNAWDITTGSTNVIVAVIDTGIRYTHHDLVNQLWNNPNPNTSGFVNDYYGINAIDGTGDPWDDVGHGTHVSGTIGASANDIYPMVGVNWRVQIMALKFLGPNGGFTSDAITCITYGIAHKARIMSNSWGGGGFDQLLLDAILAAHTNNVLFVVAAGNNATDNDSIPEYPASFNTPNMIAVAALDRADKIAFFSDWGAKSVHVGAPGVEIFSCWNGSDDDYNTIEGTSMATPHVSGVAALILAAFPKASVLEMRERILRSTVPVKDLRDITVTGGRVNAYRALRATPDGNLKADIVPPSGSVVLLSTNLSVFVTVNDLFDVTNATVQAAINGTTNVIAFRNDGKPPDVTSNDATYSAYFDLTPYTNTVFSNILTFTLSASAPGKTNYTNTVTYYIVGRPANDDFANAAKVPGEGASGSDIIVATNIFATIEAGEPKHGGDSGMTASVWWTWSPTASGNAIVDLGGTSFSAVAGIYTGNSVATLTRVASIPPGTTGKNFNGNATFAAQQGKTYRIAVAGADTNGVGVIRLRVEPGGLPDDVPPVVSFSSPASGQVFTAPVVRLTGTAYDPAPNASGVKQVLVKVNNSLPTPAVGTTNWNATVTLASVTNLVQVFGSDYEGNVSPTAQINLYYMPASPPNDVFGTVLDPSSPFYLTGTNGSSTVTNLVATKESGEPNHAGNEGGHSVWWSYLAPTNGVLTLDTQGSRFDTLLGLYTGDYVFQLRTIASNDDAFPDVKWSKISQAVRANQVYRIAVDGYGGAAGTVVLNYKFIPTNILTLNLTATAGGTVDPAPGLTDVEANSTITLTATPNNYYEFAHWQGSVTAIDNPLSIQVTTNLNINAVFRPHLFADDFETGSFTNLAWTVGGDKPWTIVSNSVTFTNGIMIGHFSARSGAITNNQSSSLILTALFQNGPANFDLKVSSEPGWDLLQFYIDGTPQQQWSGEVDWQTQRLNLAAGRHTLEWRYTKDPQNTVGQDAAWIDNLDLPLAVPVDPSVPVTLQMVQSLNGTFRIHLQGQTNQTYLLQATSSFPPQWRTLSTNQAHYGEIYFFDSDYVTFRTRFYRALAAP